MAAENHGPNLPGRSYSIVLLHISSVIKAPKLFFGFLFIEQYLYDDQTLLERTKFYTIAIVNPQISS